MKAEHEFTDAYLDDGAIGDPPQLEADDPFASVQATDESRDDDDRIQAENPDSLIRGFRRCSSVGDDARGEAFAYIQEIARTPLLTYEEEVERFQQFDAARQRVAALLDQLPPFK